jgi:hydrogenase expression/formation protein HypC
MCLAIPGRVEDVFEADGLNMAKVNFGGIRRNICLQYTPNAQIGTYVLVHVGFAISQIDEAEAQRVLQSLKEQNETALLDEFEPGGR